MGRPMSFRSSAEKVILPLLGAAIGCAVTLALGGSSGASLAAPAQPAPGSFTLPADSGSEAAQRPDAFAAWLAALEAHPRSTPLEAAREEALAEPDDEEDRLRSDASWNSLLAKVQREPVTDWSHEAGRALGSDLASLAAAQGFAVREAQCFATTCKATLEWGEEAQPLQVVESLARAQYQLNCARTVRLDEPAGDAAGRATLVLDCEHGRGPDLPAIH
jgi:hypothetical protein